MNIIFSITFILSLVCLIISNPNLALSAITSGGASAISLSLKMCGIYVFWLGIIEIIHQTKIHHRLVKIMRPLINFLFDKLDDEQLSLVSENICLNMLGVGNSATPIGIRLMQNLKRGSTATYPAIMFFVINATSVQILPTTVLSLMAEHGSVNPNSIIIPSLICSIVATTIGIVLVKVFVKR